MSWLIENARIIDGTGALLEDRYVLIEGARIAAIGPAGETPESGTLERIDGAGMTLMPGVVDCHVHLSLDGAPDSMGEAVSDTDGMAVLRMARNAERTLAAGITTVRDLGAKNHIDISYRRAVREGLYPRAPRLVLSGKPVTMTGGHCWQIGRQADGIEEVRRAAREQIKVGVDCIKLIATGGILTQGTEVGAPQLGEAEMAAAIEEAHKAGKLTAVHAHGATGIKNAVRAGIDTVEHAYFLDEEGIELMLERDCWLVPTAAAVRLVVEHGVDEGIPCAVVRKAASAVDSQAETCRTAWQAGVKLAMGTDAGTPYNRHGDNMQELDAMVGVGLSPMEAIVMATRSSAELLGMEDRIGTVAEGMEADLVLVDGDPLADISVLRNRKRISAVFQGGTLVARNGNLIRPD